jgi:hypothetical protein
MAVLVLLQAVVSTQPVVEDREGTWTGTKAQMTKLYDLNAYNKHGAWIVYHIVGDGIGQAGLGGCQGSTLSCLDVKAWFMRLQARV